MKRVLMYFVMTLGAVFVALVTVLMLNITGVIHLISPEGDKTERKSDDESIVCYIDSDGLLSVNIYDPGEYVWRYEPENSTGILLEHTADFDGYHFMIKPAEANGTGYAVVGEYEDGADADAAAHSLGAVKFSFKSGKITEILEVSHVQELSDIDFGQ